MATSITLKSPEELARQLGLLAKRVDESEISQTTTEG
jgi:hypothetical protein